MWHQNVPSPLWSRASLYTEREEQGCGGWIGVDGAFLKGEITNYLEKYASLPIVFRFLFSICGFFGHHSICILGPPTWLEKHDQTSLHTLKTRWTSLNALQPRCTRSTHEEPCCTRSDLIGFCCTRSVFFFTREKKLNPRKFSIFCPRSFQTGREKSWKQPKKNICA